VVTVYSWHTEPVPDQLPVRQVYGWIFDNDGRVTLWRDADHVGLPGGRPEPSDADIVATLRREVWEEITAEITDPHYLGYQRVDHHDRQPAFAQVRLIARLTRLHHAAPDPDTGLIKTRLAVTPHRAALALGWGEHGHQQARAAADLAFRLWSLRATTEDPDQPSTPQL
jgi:8-oxo-dGTP pyrophosphatase MutT (NUDIX family)